MFDALAPSRAREVYLKCLTCILSYPTPTTLSVLSFSGVSILKKTLTIEHGPSSF